MPLCNVHDGKIVEVVNESRIYAEVKYQDGTTGQVKKNEIEQVKMAKIANNLIDLSKYGKYDVKTESGRPALDCGDDIASNLRGKALVDVYTAAADTLEISVKELKQKYGHLNPGMQRMALGNRMRGATG